MMGRHGEGGGYKAKIAARKRGPMSSEEKLEIERLCGEMEKPTSGKIAAKINRLPSTVNWFMLTRGLIDRKPGRAARPYQRGDKMIHPYAEEHDTFIERLRSEGKPFEEIGRLVTQEFGITRTGHSVQVRIVQLAAAP